jgi:hypothetical protein
LGNFSVRSFLDDLGAATRMERGLHAVGKILRHCGLWCPASPQAPPGGDLCVHDPDSDWESPNPLQKGPANGRGGWRVQGGGRCPEPAIPP